MEQEIKKSDLSVKKINSTCSGYEEHLDNCYKELSGFANYWSKELLKNNINCR